MRNKKGKQSKTDINDSLYKTIIVLGNSSVGKTSILSQLTKNQFNVNHTSTIGLDYYHKIVDIPNTYTTCGYFIFMGHKWRGKRIISSSKKAIYQIKCFFDSMQL